MLVEAFLAEAVEGVADATVRAARWTRARRRLVGAGQAA